jgi:DNA-binding MarR family transcriptional regulator/GNAT superfamily N-acetyltransferase
MPHSSKEAISAIRKFNRFYTKQIGALDSGFLDSPYSLTEVRILYELANGSSSTPTALARNLALDLGYVSRIISSFTKNGLVVKKRSTLDARETHIALSTKGRALFRNLDRRQQQQVEKMLEPVTPESRGILLGSLESVETILGARQSSDADTITLRHHRPGDMGWIIHRQAVLYHQEYGWNEEYEAIVAEILARFIRKFDPKYERSWIAERNGQTAGSIFCVRRSPTTAQLRLLYVEPSARGLGLGTTLVRECVDFARARGYRRIVLWTQSILHSARRIYEAAGFRLVEEEHHSSFGKDNLVAQTWELSLR